MSFAVFPIILRSNQFRRLMTVTNLSLPLPFSQIPLVDLFSGERYTFFDFFAISKILIHEFYWILPRLGWSAMTCLFCRGLNGSTHRSLCCRDLRAKRPCALCLRRARSCFGWCTAAGCPWIWGLPSSKLETFQPFKFECHKWGFL